MNSSKLLLERIDPNLTKLESSIRTPAGGSKAAEDFERTVTFLLHLCGYNAIHVGSQYENATLQNRVKHYKKPTVALDVVAFSPDGREVLLCQCSLEWIPSKVKEISDISEEMRSIFSRQKWSPELHSVFVIGVSRNNIPKGNSIPDKVKIVDVTDLITLLDEVKKGNISIPTSKQYL